MLTRDVVLIFCFYLERMLKHLLRGFCTDFVARISGIFYLFNLCSILEFYQQNDRINLMSVKSLDGSHRHIQNTVCILQQI